MAEPPLTPSLVFTVDTEPDDQWAPPLADGSLPPFSFANTRGLGRLIDFFHERELPVTWMTSYSIARDRESASVLRRAAREGDEIAGHLHGWETEPYIDIDRCHRPFIGEYPPDLRLEKHRRLLAAHEDAFDARPVSYRAGRWGVDAIELQHLAELGYEIDSSITPGIDFRDRAGLAQLGPDFRADLRSAAPYKTGTLWEVPASILPLGALGGGPAAVAVARIAGRRAPGSRMHRLLSRTLAATRLQELVWIRPLRHPAARLARATATLLRRRSPIVNVMFHSSEAFLDTSPLSRRPEDVERLYRHLDTIIATARAHGAVGRTLRDAVAAISSAAAPQTR